MKTIYHTLCLCATIISAITTLTACSEDSDLEGVIWIDDAEYDGLPAYTELGYNSFGAYVNNRTFSSGKHYDESKMQFRSDENTLTFTLKSPEYYSYYSTFHTLSFTFPYKHITKYTELKSLNNKTIDLADTSVIVSATIYTDENNYDNVTLNIEKGTLHFKHSQMLFVDEDMVEAIVSGTFEFDATASNSTAYEVRHGRFDMGADGDDIKF